MKKTVLHVVETLAVGGAEVLLVESLKSISDNYRHVLVYMHLPNPLLSEVTADKVYCLNYKGKSNFLSCVYKLQKIIKYEKVNLLHSHHYWPTIIARLAKPSQVPLLFTIHSPLSQDAFLPNRWSLFLERLTYRRDHHAVFVSNSVLKDYCQYIDIKGKSTVLYNFVSNAFFDKIYTKVIDTTPFNSLRLVAVGNLKKVKNYIYLLRTFKILKDKEIYLDIIGEGELLKQLEATIKESGIVKVNLRGTSGKVYELLNKYDAFILASRYEGLSLAVIEAMAVGLPCILSDIASNREVAGDAALFFDLSSPEDCASKLIELLGNQQALRYLSAASKQKALSFQVKRYLDELEEIYNQYL